MPTHTHTHTHTPHTHTALPNEVLPVVVGGPDQDASDVLQGQHEVLASGQRGDGHIATDWSLTLLPVSLSTTTTTMSPTATCDSEQLSTTPSPTEASQL